MRRRVHFISVQKLQRANLLSSWLSRMLCILQCSGAKQYFLPSVLILVCKAGFGDRGSAFLGCGPAAGSA
jgi:hypothetical protein